MRISLCYFIYASFIEDCRSCSSSLCCALSVPGNTSLLAQIKAGKQLNKIDIEALRKVLACAIVSRRVVCCVSCRVGDQSSEGPYTTINKSQKRKRQSSMSLSVIAQTLRAAIDLKFDEDDDDDDEPADGGGEEWDEDVWDEEDCF